MTRPDTPPPERLGPFEIQYRCDSNRPWCWTALLYQGGHYQYLRIGRTRWGARNSILNGMNKSTYKQFRTLEKEAKKNGKHRQTETDHPNPNPNPESNITITPSGATTATVTAALAAYAGLTQPDTPDTPDTLEIIDETIPILAHRAARLIVTRNGIRLASLNGGLLAIDAAARCRCPNPKWLHASMYATLGGRPTGYHQQIGPDTDCGFYAVPLDLDAWHDDTTVDLTVELSGIVIEHEHGYRASHQTIIAARIEPCRYCRQPATHIAFNNERMSGWGCDRHPADGITVTLPELQTSIAIPVTSEPAPAL